MADKTSDNVSGTLVDRNLSVIGVASTEKKAVKSPEMLATKKSRRKSNLHLCRSLQLMQDEQSYRETVHGIRSFMGWTHTPDVDNKHWAGSVLKYRLMSVSAKKFDTLNITSVEGYPSRVSEASGLQRDLFVKVGKSQSKWYGLHSNKEKSAASVSC